MTAAEPGERIRAALTTTPVVVRAPLPPGIAAPLGRDLDEVIRYWTRRLSEMAVDPDPPQPGLSQQRLLRGITVVTALLEEAQQLQQELLRQALEAGVSQQRIADAMGVRQQAVSKRAQRRL